MGTIVLYAVIAIAVAAAMVALMVVVLPDDRMSRPQRDVVPLGLPFDREVGAEDLNRMRLPVTVRGYRMVDTDAVLDRLSAEIERRDREIAELRMNAGMAPIGAAPARGDTPLVESPADRAADAPADFEPASADFEPAPPEDPSDRGAHRL